MQGEYQIIDVSDCEKRSKLFIQYKIEADESSEFICECRSIDAAKAIVTALSKELPDKPIISGESLKKMLFKQLDDVGKMPPLNFTTTEFAWRPEFKKDRQPKNPLSITLMQIIDDIECGRVTPNGIEINYGVSEGESLGCRTVTPTGERTITINLSDSGSIKWQ